MKKVEVLPVLSLLDAVIYPHVVVPLFVSRNKSIQALAAAMNSGKQIFIVAQKPNTSEDYKIKDLYKFGTVANILQLLKLPDGKVKILAEGM